MNCVENHGYNNLYQGLSLGFSLRCTPQHMWVMGVYIVWV